jgi:predicted RNA-binding Zn ribbon-like protein
MTAEQALPRSVLLLRDFVNTREPQVGAESLIGPDDLRTWLADHGLVPADAPLGPDDLEMALTIREGLRDVLLGHNGDQRDSAALERLNGALARVPVRLAFTGTGHHVTAVATSPIDQAVAGLIDAIRQCTEEHTWDNLKVCARDSCRWAFYDGSRNHARRWCSMAGCGNHVKMKRAYAARKVRNATSTGGD